MWHRNFFWIAVVLQVAAVLTFAGWREVSLRTGTEVVLATVPVDPRDIFRGDYVVLRYGISTLPNCYGSDGDEIDVLLRRGPDVWYAAGRRWGLEAPEEGTVVIRGRITRTYRGSCDVAYGIESYFVPEGTGRAIERARGKVNVHVVVDGFGSATIKSIDVP